MQNIFKEEDEVCLLDQMLGPEGVIPVWHVHFGACEFDASNCHAPSWYRAEVGRPTLDSVQFARAKVDAPNWKPTIYGNMRLVLWTINLESNLIKRFLKGG